ncbi:apolipoprotein N-acyltransferase [Hoeflea poritis]|uniref:Apolipoprotein N-acyltransferase n=1 Tax=Hoeflea poritis TaxID=2993659 RepID=A0ABT4VNN2_9HYPH|nr:apolipoprotein N-acyltransferase [Hoeflea poritis]MDA4846301.1 apolipoprotein N-acyltransferase [Hoeflea poritis]
MERLAGKIMLLWGARRWIVSFCAGAVGVLSLPPFDFFAALFISFPVLVWLLDGASGDAEAGPLGRLMPAFWTGWWFGFGYFVAGLWWLGNALLVEAEQFAWALPLAVLGLPALLAIFYGLATAFARLLWSDGFGRLCALACGFGLAEWLRSFALTGFPWNAIGYGLMPAPVMMQASALIGIFGMSALAVLVFSVPALFATRRGLVPALVIGVALLALQFGYGFWRLAQPEPEGSGEIVVRIVQPSVDQSKKWDDDERRAIFDTLLSLTRGESQSGAKPTHIVWPETSVPFVLTSNPAALAMIGEALDDGQTLITGAVREERNESGEARRYYNSIYVIDDKGQITSAADKIHLVPFGEYLPFAGLLQSIGLETIAHAPGQFSAGSRRQSVPVPGGRRFLPLICYEVIFPGELKLEGPPADFILNVTNDAWYGRTPGPYQHFRQAQLRAVETGLPLVRAANNGISAVTDAKGRVLDGMSQNVIGSVDIELPAKLHANRGSWTPEIAFWLITALLLLVALVSRYNFARTSN